MTAFTKIRKLGATAALSLALGIPASLTATADPDIVYEDRPFKVFVDLQTATFEDRPYRRYEPRGGDPRRRPRLKHQRPEHPQPSRRHDRYRRDYDMHYDALTMRELHERLPDNILIVDSPYYADMVMNVRQDSYNLNFRIVDTDRKDKKYKKSRRYTGGRCGVYKRAYYTRIKEKGEAHASYSLKITLRGIDKYRDDLRLRASEHFKYGQNLTARTNCGRRPTSHMPSNGVAKLFSKAHPEYRHHVAEEIREEAAEELGEKLARHIRKQAHRFYAYMENHPRYGAYRENNHHEDSLEREVARVVARIILD